MQSQLLSPKQLADRCGWPVGRIRSLIAKREIRHVRIGGSLFLPETAIEEYLIANMIEPNGDSKAPSTNAKCENGGIR